MKLKRNQTQKGFDYYEFKDRYNIPCSIQKSSLASEDAIWLGVDDPNPRILASKNDPDKTGWEKYYVPKEVLITSRMHLTRMQVRELLPILKRFADTGEI